MGNPNLAHSIQSDELPVPKDEVSLKREHDVKKTKDSSGDDPPGSVLFTETPTMEGNYPSNSTEAPLGDRNIPKNEVQMGRNETNSNSNPKSGAVDAKSDVSLQNHDPPIADTTAAENVLEHHAN